MQVTNTLGAQSAININQQKKGIEDELGKISSAQKPAAADPATAMIAHAMMSDVLSDGQGVMNANDAISMMQIADSTLSNVSQMGTRLNELSVASNSAALNESQKNMLSSEFSATVSAMNDAMAQTTFNGKALFGSEMSFSLGDGEMTARVGELNTQSLSIDSQESIENFARSLETVRNEVGATANSLESSVNSMLTEMTQKSAARSQMADTDMAKSVSDFEANGIKLNMATLAQAHQNNFLATRIQTLLG
ncbi:MAG: flagellin [Sulfurimonadaceae bacterium]